MKFLGDIPIGRSTLDFLRNLGHDCIAARERLAPNTTDPEILRLAAAEGRTVICFDLGMSALVALSGERLPSVITFRTSRQSASYLNTLLAELLPQLESALASGSLVTIDDARARVRPLPVTPLKGKTP